MSPARSGLLCLLSIDSLFLNLVLKLVTKHGAGMQPRQDLQDTKERKDYMYILDSSLTVIYVPMAMAMAALTVGACAAKLGQKHLFQRSAHSTHRSTITATVGHIDKHRVPCSDGWTVHVYGTVNGRHAQTELAPPFTRRKFHRNTSRIALTAPPSPPLSCCKSKRAQGRASVAVRGVPAPHRVDADHTLCRQCAE